MYNLNPSLISTEMKRKGIFDAQLLIRTRILETRWSLLNFKKYSLFYY